MTRRKKSLFVVIGGLSRGGCEMHLAMILPELIRRGYSVEIFLLGFRGPLAGEIERNGILITNPWIKSDPSKRNNIARRLLRLILVSIQMFFRLIWARPSIVHFFLPASYQLGGPISLLSGRSIRIMSRRSLNNYKRGNRALEGLEAWLHKRMDVLLGNSAAVVAELRNEAPASTQIELIYNGVNTPNPQSTSATEIRDSLKINPDQMVLCVVANLIPYKGHMDLLNAIHLVEKELPRNWVLLLAGRDDGLGPELNNLLVELGFSDRVIFLGSHSNIPALLQASDVFILPSHQEGFSNALLEAMVAKIAIIATDVGGNAEAIEHGVSGLLVPPRDPASLGEAIATLTNDETKRAVFATAAAKRAGHHFTLKACIDHYDKLYTSLLAQRC
jgi:glycosyltransferase involved in cell wall biosynthesis